MTDDPPGYILGDVPPGYTTAPPLVWADIQRLFEKLRDTPPRWHGSPQDPHIYSPNPQSRYYRQCTECGHVRGPVLESITLHPSDKEWFAQRLQEIRILGEPIPDGTLILESDAVRSDSVRLRIDGRDITAPNLRPNAPAAPRWVPMDPWTGWLGGL